MDHVENSIDSKNKNAFSEKNSFRGGFQDDLTIKEEENDLSDNDSVDKQVENLSINCCFGFNDTDSKKKTS